MLSRTYFEVTQNRDGGWGYTPRQAIDRKHDLRRNLQPDPVGVTTVREPRASFRARSIRDCGKGGYNPNLAKGIDWLANHFDVQQNFGNGQQWKFYYLYALERAGRLGGVRFFGQNDWYRLGAEQIVKEQKPLSGFWHGGGQENELVATVLRPALSGQRARAGIDQQAATSSGTGLEQRP